MKRKLIDAKVLALYVAPAFFLVNTTAHSVSLEEAVCRMLEYEPELNATEYDTLSAQRDQIVARSELMPQVTLDGSAGYSKRNRTSGGVQTNGDPLFQRQVGVNLRQLLYDGGSGLNNAKASRNSFLAQQLLEKGFIEERVVDLAETYMEVIRTRRQIALAERNVNNHVRMRDLLKQRADAGGSRSDFALVQGRLGLATNQLDTQRLALETAEARFQRLTGMAPSGLAYPAIPSIASTRSAIDYSANFNLKSAAEALEAAQHRARASKTLTHPRVFFDAGVTYGQDTSGVRGESTESRAGLTGSWDLFRGHRNRALHERDHFQVGKYEELLRAAELEAGYNLNLLWQERVGSQNSIEALRLYSTELNQVVSDYQQRFEVGRQELLNILDVQSEAYTASSRLLDAEFNVDTTAYRIYGVQGRATEFILGPDGCERCYSAKGLVSEKWVVESRDNIDPDNRVPVTQADLMNRRFDTDGPEAEYGDLQTRYYVERAQLPIEPKADARPTGKFFGLFKRKGSQRSGSAPIFK